jgi:hypothetical protein
VDGVDVVGSWLAAATEGADRVVPYGIWLLALVFLWSGSAKVRRPLLAAAALVDFGVTKRPRPGHGYLLGGVELALGLALAAMAPQVPTLAAAVVLTVFAVFVVRAVLNGARFPCGCFGEWHAAISPLTAARTVFLAVLAWALAGATLLAGADTRHDAAVVASTLAVLATIVLAARIPQLVRDAHRLRDVLELDRSREPA